MKLLTSIYERLQWERTLNIQVFQEPPQTAHVNINHVSTNGRFRGDNFLISIEKPWPVGSTYFGVRHPLHLILPLDNGRTLSPIG